MDEYLDVNKVLQFNEEFLNYLRKHSVTATRLDKGIYPFDDGIRIHPFYPEIKTRKDGICTSFLGIGCGFGTAERQVILAGMKKENVNGIDIKPDRIELGFRIYQDKDAMKNNFIIGNALSLHDYFLPESFDYVYSSYLINLLENHENVKKYLENAYWVLRQDGTFFGRTIQNRNGFNISSNELEEYLDKAGFKRIFAENRYQNGKNILYFHCHKLQQG